MKLGLLALKAALAFAICACLFAANSEAKFKLKEDKYNVNRDASLNENLRNNDSDEGDIVSITIKETVSGTERNVVYPITSGTPFSSPLVALNGATLTVNANGAMIFDPRPDSVYSQLFAGDELRFEFKYTAREDDDPGNTQTKKVKIKIKGVAPEPPAARNDGTFRSVANLLLTVTAEGGLLANDTNALYVSKIRVDGTIYAISQGGNSAPVTLDDGAILTVSSDGSLNFDPRPDANLQALTASESEEFDFDYKAHNEEDESNWAAVDLEITGLDLELPIARNDGFTIIANQVLNKDATNGPLANDTNPLPGDLTVSRLLVNGGSLTLGQTHTLSTFATLRVNVDGSLVFDPTSATAYQSLTRDAAPLTQTFTYVTENSDGDSNDATVTITITPNQVNTPAAATDDAVTLQEDAGRTRIFPLNNDSGDPALEIISISGSGTTGTISQGGILQSVENSLVLASGELYYTAWDDFNGQDTFTYTLQDDDGEQDTATITITVAAVNDAPDVLLGLQGAMLQGTSKTWNGRYASDNAPLGLRARVFDRDNTIYDGLGCDPEAEDCASMQSLYFSLGDPVDDNGNVQGTISDAATCGDGSFTYTPRQIFQAALALISTPATPTSAQESRANA